MNLKSVEEFAMGRNSGAKALYAKELRIEIQPVGSPVEVRFSFFEKSLEERVAESSGQSPGMVGLGIRGTTTLFSPKTRLWIRSLRNRAAKKTPGDSSSNLGRATYTFLPICIRTY